MSVNLYGYESLFQKNKAKQNKKQKKHNASSDSHLLLSPQKMFPQGSKHSFRQQIFFLFESLSITEHRQNSLN